MNGFCFIEVLIALALLSLIACGTSQYFVWMAQRSRANFDRSQAAALQVVGTTQNNKRAPPSKQSQHNQPTTSPLPNQLEYG